MVECGPVATRWNRSPQIFSVSGLKVPEPCGWPWWLHHHQHTCLSNRCSRSPCMVRPLKMAVLLFSVHPLPDQCLFPSCDYPIFLIIELNLPLVTDESIWCQFPLEMVASFSPAMKSAAMSCLLSATRGGVLLQEPLCRIPLSNNSLMLMSLSPDSFFGLKAGQQVTTRLAGL